MKWLADEFHIEHCWFIQPHVYAKVNKYHLLWWAASLPVPSPLLSLTRPPSSHSSARSPLSRRGAWHVRHVFSALTPLSPGRGYHLSSRYSRMRGLNAWHADTRAQSWTNPYLVIQIHNRVPLSTYTAVWRVCNMFCGSTLSCLGSYSTTQQPKVTLGKHLYTRASWMSLRLYV